MHAVQIPLHDICTALQAVASVDVSSTTSALEQHQTAAYLPVERQLAKLEALSSMRPLCYAEHKEIYRSACQLAQATHDGKTTALCGALAFQDTPEQALMHVCVMHITLGCKLKIVVDACETSESTGTCT